MQSHQEIDERSLAMVHQIVAKIDQDPLRQGLERARANCQKWPATRATREWAEILENSWEIVREVLLDPSEEGRRLRQSDPFVGILSPQERWSFYRRPKS
jgi:hypothetical protein